MRIVLTIILFLFSSHALAQTLPPPCKINIFFGGCSFQLHEAIPTQTRWTLEPQFDGIQVAADGQTILTIGEQIKMTVAGRIAVRFDRPIRAMYDLSFPRRDWQTPRGLANIEGKWAALVSYCGPCSAALPIRYALVDLESGLVYENQVSSERNSVTFIKPKVEEQALVHGVRVDGLGSWKSTETRAKYVANFSGSTPTVRKFLYSASRGEFILQEETEVGPGVDISLPLVGTLSVEAIDYRHRKIRYSVNITSDRNYEIR